MDDEQLLMVGTERQDPLIQHHLATVAIDLLLQPAVGGFAEREPFRVRAPDQPPDLNPSLGQRR